MALSSIEMEMIEVLMLLGHTPSEITRKIPSVMGLDQGTVEYYVYKIYKPMMRMSGYTRPPREDLLKRKARLFGDDTLTGLTGGPSVVVPAPDKGKEP